MIRYPGTLTCGLALIVLAGLGAAYFRHEAERRADIGAPDDAVPPVQVTAEAVARTTRPQVFHTRGVVTGIAEVRVASEVEGRVAMRHVREGQSIAAGDTLCTIDPTFHVLAVTAAEAGLAEAEAQLSNATAEVQRLQNIGDDARAAIELNRFRTARDRAAAARDLARTELTRATELLERTSIVAPISGVVSAVFFEQGELLAPTQPVVEIVDLNDIRLIVEVTPLEAAHLGSDATITLTTPALPNATLPGRLHAVYPKANPLTRRIPVEVRAANPQHGLRSGTIVDCRIETVRSTAALVIPARAVLHDFATQTIFVAHPTDDGHVAQRRQIQTAPLPDSVTVVEVIAGLEPGELLVLDHLQELRDAQPLALRSATVAQ